MSSTISDIRHPISDKAQPFNLRDDCACCAQSDSRQAAGDDLLQHDGLQTQRFARHHHCHHYDHLQHLDHPHIAHHQDISFNTMCPSKITTITIFAIKIKMSHPCLAYHHHHNPATYIYFHFDFENVLFPCNTHSFIHPSQMVGKKSYFSENHILQRFTKSLSGSS